VIALVLSWNGEYVCCLGNQFQEIAFREIRFVLTSIPLGWVVAIHFVAVKQTCFLGQFLKGSAQVRPLHPHNRFKTLFVMLYGVCR
jgi:hypothetical protein